MHMMYVYVCVFVCMYMCACSYVCICVRVRIRTCIRAIQMWAMEERCLLLYLVCMHTCVCVYVHMYVYLVAERRQKHPVPGDYLQLGVPPQRI
jgi:hypothetical protein